MVAARQITVEEFERTPRQGIWELVDGEPIELTPAAGRSGWISGNVFALLSNHVRQRHLGWAFPPETGFVLFSDRQTVRSPDAAVVLRDRLAAPPDTFVPLAPDVAVEVLSPSDRMADAMSKITMYLQAGVRLVWLVDPDTRTVTVFQQDAAPQTVGEDHILDGGDVLPGFQVPVAEIFGEE